MAIHPRNLPDAPSFQCKEGCSRAGIHPPWFRVQMVFADPVGSQPGLTCLGEGQEVPEFVLVMQPFSSWCMYQAPTWVPQQDGSQTRAVQYGTCKHLVEALFVEQLQGLDLAPCRRGKQPCLCVMPTWPGPSTDEALPVGCWLCHGPAVWYLMHKG